MPVIIKFVGIEMRRVYCVQQLNLVYLVYIWMEGFDPMFIGVTDLCPSYLSCEKALK